MNNDTLEAIRKRQAERKQWAATDVTRTEHEEVMPQTLDDIDLLLDEIQRLHVGLADIGKEDCNECDERATFLHANKARRLLGLPDLS